MILPLILSLGSLSFGGVPTPSLPVVQAQESEFPGPPLAIDGVEISFVEFANWLVELQGFNNLEAYIEEHLIQMEFRRAGLEVTAQEVRELIEQEVATRIERAFGGDRQLWLAELERLGQDETTFFAERTWEVRHMLALDKLVQSRRVVTAEQVRQAWEQQYGPGGRRLYVSRILLRVRGEAHTTGATRDDSLESGRKAQEEAKARATDLYERMLKEGDFARFVPEFSEDYQTRKKGGALPEPVIPGDWPGLDFAALQKLEIGDLFPPFLSAGGFNLFRLDRDQVTPLEEVQAEIHLRLQNAPADQAEIGSLLGTLKAGANVERLEEVRREVTPDKHRFDRPVAVVDGKPLLRGDFARWLVSSRGQALARGFAQQRWTEQQAKALGCEPNALMIEQRVQKDLDTQIQSFYGGDRQKWAADLAKKGRDVSDMTYQAKLRTRQNLRAEGLMLRERVITDEMIRREWENRYGEGGRALDIRLIRRGLPEPELDQLKTDEDLQAYIIEQSAEVKSFLSGLALRVADGEDFGALARTYSEDLKTRDLGGRTPERFELHTWPEAAQKLLRELEVGQVTEPYEMTHQFFLFHLAGRIHVPLEDVREELRKELMARPPSAVEVSAFVNQSTLDMRVDILPAMTQ